VKQGPKVDLLGLAAMCSKAGLEEVAAWLVSEFNRRERRKRMLQKYAMVLEAMVAGIDLDLASEGNEGSST
jgi:ferritin